MKLPALGKKIPKTPEGLLKPLILLSIPLIFLFGGSLCVVIFAAVALGRPVPVPITKLSRLSPVKFSSPPPGEVVLGKSIVRKEARPLILKKYLESHNSPLAEHSEFMIETAEKYNLDWRLLPAIAGQESTFCRNLPPDSHNCWGWGIHTRGTLGFDSWETAIETVAKGLKKEYVNKGYKTPEQIMRKYCPRSITEAGGSWAEGVKYFINQIEHF